MLRTRFYGGYILGLEIDIDAVRGRFREANMLGALQFLDFILTDEGKQLDSIAGKIMSDEGGMGICIGASPQDPDATPFGDLVKLSLELHKHSKRNLIYLDAFMAAMATNPRLNQPVMIEATTSIN